MAIRQFFSMQPTLITGADSHNRQQKVCQILKLNFETIFGTKAANNPHLFLTNDAPIGIEKIRELISFLSLKPFSEEKKMVIINEAQNITREAQNALLKTLEEPSINSFIFLLTPWKNFLLPTVISRCKIIDLGLKKASWHDFEKRKKLFLNLLKSKTSEKLIWAEKNKDVIKDREHVVSFIDVGLIVLRDYLIQGKYSDKKRLIGIIKRFLGAKKVLQTTNVNAKLTLENLLLHC